MVALGQVILPQLDPRAAAATLLAPLGDAKLPLTGTTTITSITAAGRGQLLLLEFASAACQVTNGSNLKLRANYVSTAFGTLLLECDGTNWIEVTRNPTGPLTVLASELPLATTWTLTSITQSVNVTFTTGYARIATFGKTAHVQAYWTLTGVGTAGNAIALTVPAALTPAAAYASGSCLGSYHYLRGAGPVWSGTVDVTGTSTVWFLVAGGGLNFIGLSPSFATANGDILSINAVYELA